MRERSKCMSANAVRMKTHLLYLRVRIYSEMAEDCGNSMISRYGKRLKRHRLFITFFAALSRRHRSFSEMRTR